MKIMQAVSVYQLLELIVYRIKYLNEENIILIMPQWIRSKFINETIISSLFTKIIYFNFFPDFSNPNVDKDIINYYDELFYSNDIDISQCEEFHVAGAHYGIGSYLCLKQINFILWEEAAGIISQPQILRNIESGISINRLKFNNTLGIIDGSSPYIYKIFANIDAQVDNFPEKVCNYNIINELQTMDVLERNNVISIFAPNNIEIPSNAVILLTEHFANCKRLSFEEQILIYQLFFDYFLQEETVVIKPHPDDLMYYEQLFENVWIVHEKFPAEFIPFIFNNKPKKIATISSASVKTLNTQFKEVLFLGNDFEKRFKIIHKYFFALYIALGLQEYQHIKKIGTYNILLDTLLSTEYFIATPNANISPQTQVYIIDDYEKNIFDNDIIQQLLNSSDNDCYIFINSLEKNIFYDVYKAEIWDDIIPVIIHKTKNNENTLDFYSDLKDEKLFVFTKNKHIKERIKKMSKKHFLKNTNITLEKNALDDYSLELEILRGKLEATEKRLLYYINLVETLEKKEGEQI